jgi:laminin B (domain IV)
MTKAEQGLSTSAFGHIMMLRRTTRRIFSQDDAMIQARDFGAAFAALVCALFLIVPARAQTHSGMILIRHDFAESAQGWLISGDANMKEPIHSAGGGHPGGSITGIDDALGETWYFRAPDTVLQQLPAAVNGTISFSFKQSGTAVSLIDDDIVIVGPAGRLTYRFPTDPGTDWKDYSVRLSASPGWTWNWNRRATQAQLESVLAAPTRLEIRGEYVTGDDQGSLSNFVLTAAPK